MKVKLDKETLKAIWDASRPNVERNKRSITVKKSIKMKKRKLNSKNPKYRSEAQIKADEKPIEKQVLIKDVKGAKVYATFYKQDTNNN